ncbi:hypothetical protein MXD62_29605 [Frankia sp. Mgl5]|uniref:hypothetical protein n=1 Tax=Frankia sp. Mgl5 TaxID=2933793 RepID=UPI00200EE85A|nr:hypothetical protein [Frankia sp. Mgl5]MCK9931247.1 hypothetical protein [Frankia sp. Mgl5]
MRTTGTAADPADPAEPSDPLPADPVPPDPVPAGARRDGPRPSHRHRRQRRRRRPLGRAGLVPAAVLAGYLALAVAVFRAAWADPGGVVYGYSDSVLFAWYLGWVPHALSAGIDPFVTSYLNAPTGTNILWSTPVPLLGLVTAPVTALFGPVVSLTLLLTLAPALSAFALFWVLRRWVPAPPAAVAGLLYGFGPYMVGESYGHLHLTFAVFPPLLLLLLDDLIVRRRPPGRTGVLLGLAVAAQAMISEEVLATAALLGALGLAIAGLVHRAAVRARAGALLRGLAACGTTAGALLAWPLTAQFLGDQRVHGNIQPHNVAVSDLLTFVTPTPAQRIAPDAALRHSLRFTGNAVEVTGYLGLPLLLGVAAIAVRFRREPLVAVFAPLGAVTALLSLGGHLHVDGRVTGIRLPWLPLENLPVISSALPSRLALYLAMSVAIVLAVGLTRVAAAARFPRPVTRAGLVLLTAVMLAPLVPRSHVATPAATPAFFTGDAVRAVPEGSTALVLPYPYPARTEAMLWQAEAGYRFRLPGCYCTVPGPDGRAVFNAWTDPLNSALVAVEQGRSDAAAALADPAVRAAFDRLAPAAVILGPSANRDELARLVTGLAGAGPADVDGVQLWLTAP